MSGYRYGRRVAAALTMGIAAAVVLAACSSSPSGGSSSSAAAPASSAAAAVTKVDACASGSDPATTFKLGTFLPLTGSLAAYGPSAVGASDLALSDINAAGGVNGTPACTVATDSSDADNPTVGAGNIKKLLQAKVSAILGAESSSVTENVLKTVSASSTVMFSPANTDDALTGASKWYFRDAPPNSVEGNALGTQIVKDGHSKTAILVFNDSYGTNLRDSTEASIVKNGGTVVYGAKGKNQEFPSTETNFGSDVSAALATKPDSLVVIAFEQTQPLVSALVSAGWAMKNTYFVDGNIGSYPKLPANTLTGVKASTQGVNPTPAFTKLVAAAYKANGNTTAITTNSYAAESYDAVVIMALAADEAKTSSPTGIQSKILPVTGTTNGTVCKSYAACDKLIKAGTDIHYEGYSGIGPLNAGHDPSSGYISIYQYKGNDPSEFLGSVKG
jgi:neutral amino acid transport system substrate-binding protein